MLRATVLNRYRSGMSRSEVHWRPVVTLPRSFALGGWRRDSLPAVSMIALGWLTAVASSPVHAALLFGAPSSNGSSSAIYSTSSISGFRSVGNSVAVGSAQLIQTGNSLGFRALRWTPTGFQQLSTLGLTNAGYGEASALSVNASGAAVGSSMLYWSSGFNAGQRAVRWDALSTEVRALPTIGSSVTSGMASNAFALNDDGTAVGFSNKYAPGRVFMGSRAVRWSGVDDMAEELGDIGLDASGYAQAAAYDVNPVGTAVGYATKYTDGITRGERAVRWLPNSSSAIELESIGVDSLGRAYASAIAVNASGTVVGKSTKNNSATLFGTVAARWEAGSTIAVELGSLGENSAGERSSSASDINNVGTVVGRSDKYVAGRLVGPRAVRWEAGSATPTELGTLGTSAAGVSTCVADAINNLGVAVGLADKYDGTIRRGSRAVAWLADSTEAIDLNGLLSAIDSARWTLTRARSITDVGWISGFADYRESSGAPVQSRAFLLLVPSAGTYGSGDANFDTRVNFDDLLVLAANYNQSSNGSTSVADFNLDGVTNFDDLLTLAAHYNSGGAGSSPAAGALVLVPEPAAASTVTVTLLQLLRRWRPRRS
jgi:hypothetical protein